MIDKILAKLKDSSELRKSVIKGGVFLFGGNVAENGLRFIRNMILTRMIAPNEFGVVAILLAMNQLFNSLTQIGIKEAIIQNEKGGTKTFLDAAFWLSTIRGVCLFAVAFLAAPFIAGFYQKPYITHLLQIAFLDLLFSSINSVRAFAIMKEMKYLRYVIYTFGGNGIGILVTIVLGVMYRNVQALVMGFVAESLARLILSYALFPYFPSFKIEKESRTALLKYAKSMLGLPIFFFLYARIDVFVLGKLSTDYQLGIFSMVQTLAFTPIVFYDGMSGQILMPVFSKNAGDLDKLRSVYLKVVTLSSRIALPILFLLGIFSSELLRLFYGEKYVGGSYLLILFIVVVGLRIIGGLAGNLFFATNSAGDYRSVTMARLIAMMIAVIPLIKLYGASGAVYANIIALALWLVLLMVKLRGILLVSIKDQVLAIFPGKAYAVILVGAAVLIWAVKMLIVNFIRS
jgi:O-antigen/teichoic acid export membrane protein